MNLSVQQLLKFLILTLLFPLLFLNGWLLLRLFQYFQPLVTIIILSALFAFILNYPVSRLEQQGVKRSYGVILVFILASLVVVTLGITLLPIISEQFHEMVKLLPQWIDSSEVKLQRLNDWAFSKSIRIDVSQIFAKIMDKIPEELEEISNKLLSIIVETIDSISEALITVVLSFYLLLDGSRLWQVIFQKIPGVFAQKINDSIQQNFQNYLIGQVTLALIMGVSQTLMFLLFQVQFGLLFGLGVGILSLIPFGDVVSLIVITLIIATHDFWLAVKVLAVAIIIDQLIDQAIAPRLLGSFTGLRPIWVLISLLVGTYVGGVLGLIIAVPVAGLIKDIIDGFTSLNDSDTAVAGGNAEIFPPSSTSA